MPLLHVVIPCYGCSRVPTTLELHATALCTFPKAVRPCSNNLTSFLLVCVAPVHLGLQPILLCVRDVAEYDHVSRGNGSIRRVVAPRVRAKDVEIIHVVRSHALELPRALNALLGID